jgi:hypothetical protein
MLVVNVNPLINSLERSASRVDLATGAAASAGAEVFARYIRQELGKSTHGKREKTESAPGEPPAKITGTLQRSVKVFIPKRLGPSRYVAEAGPDEFYGRFHQTGTKHERAHPFIEEAAHAAEASGLVHAACVKVWQAAVGI